MSNKTTNPTLPMKAEEYWRECGYPKHSIMTEEQQRFIFAERYATYRLQFEREQQQSWMPTEDEWMRFPEAKCAAMDNNGDVYTFWCYLEDLELRGNCWHGEHPYYIIKTVDPTNLNWRQCKVARPEGM